MRESRCARLAVWSGGLLGLLLVLPGAVGAQVVKVVGSETLAPVVGVLAEAFESRRPGLRFEIEARGSSAAPPALLIGEAQLAAMSRPMNDAELSSFQRRYGREPTAIAIAMDAVVVFVQKDNPLERLRVEQLDAVFSRTRRCGEHKAARIWGDLGLGGEWASREIQRFGRNERSGTHTFFREVALCGGLFDRGVRERPGPDSVRLSVAESEFGIGYGGRAVLRMDGIRALAIAGPGADRYGFPVAGDVKDGAYPLTRRLLLYYNEGSAGADVREFAAFATSRDGQALVERIGYLPAVDVRVDR